MSCATETKCEWCDRKLTAEEREYPRRDDEAICDDCYYRHYTYTCAWCEEYGDIDWLCRVGSLFAVFKPVGAYAPYLRPGTSCPWYSFRDLVMRPGIYRIKRWPIYWDAMLDAGLYAEAFEWFSPLPAEWARRGGWAGYPCGPLCEACQWGLKHAKWRVGGARAAMAWGVT